jgi:poly(A) polymerase
MAVSRSTPESVLEVVRMARLAGEAAGAISRAAVPRVDPTLVQQIDPKDLRLAIQESLEARYPDVALDVLEASGILAVFLPEVTELVGFGDGEWRHKDVWKHTKQVVLQSEPTPILRWAALLHDIGKPRTRKISPDGQVHFLGHSEVGASMFDRMCSRVPFDAEMRERIRFLILHHLRANQYDPSWTDSAVRRFAREMDTCLPELLALSRADITTKRPERKARGLKAITDLGERIRLLAEADAKLPPLPKGLGEALMAHLGIPAGPRIGQLKKKLEKMVEDGELEARQDAEYYVAALSRIET